MIWKIQLYRILAIEFVAESGTNCIAPNLSDSWYFEELSLNEHLLIHNHEPTKYEEVLYLLEYFAAYLAWTIL